MIALREAFDIVVMVAFLAYIFHDIIRPRRGQNIIHYVDKGLLGDDLRNKAWWDDLWFTIAVVAPCIILHELAHKFIAIGFGYNAVFYAFYHQTFTLILGVLAVLSKYFDWGFILIVPGFVQILGDTTAGASALIAAAGPAIHAAFWLAALAVLRLGWASTQRANEFWVMTKKLNGFLFLFNMLPFPGIDGFTVYTSIAQLL